MALVKISLAVARSDTVGFRFMLGFLAGKVDYCCYLGSALIKGLSKWGALVDLIVRGLQQP